MLKHKQFLPFNDFDFFLILMNEMKKDSDYKDITISRHDYTQQIEDRVNQYEKINFGVSSRNFDFFVCPEGFPVAATIDKTKIIGLKDFLNALEYYSDA